MKIKAVVEELALVHGVHSFLIPRTRGVVFVAFIIECLFEVALFWQGKSNPVDSRELNGGKEVDKAILHHLGIVENFRSDKR